MELIEDTRARAFRNSRNAAQGIQGIQGVYHSAQSVRSAQDNHILKEPCYNQINVEFRRKFVRPYNFKRGHRRKFFLFAEDQDLARNPKSVCPLCNPI